MGSADHGRFADRIQHANPSTIAHILWPFVPAHGLVPCWHNAYRTAHHHHSKTRGSCVRLALGAGFASHLVPMLAPQVMPVLGRSCIIPRLFIRYAVSVTDDSSARRRAVGCRVSGTEEVLAILVITYPRITAAPQEQSPRVNDHKTICDRVVDCMGVLHLIPATTIGAVNWYCKTEVCLVNALSPSLRHNRH